MPIMTKITKVYLATNTFRCLFIGNESYATNG